MALTDVKIRSLASEKGKMKHHDRDELYLYVYKSGIKTFYFRKKIDGKVREIRIGNYPAISLAEARRKSDEIRDRLLRGEEPLEKAPEKEIYTLEKAITEWFSAIRGEIERGHREKNGWPD